MPALSPTMSQGNIAAWMVRSSASCLHEAAFSLVSRWLKHPDLCVWIAGY